MIKSEWFDSFLYPDVDLPDSLEALADWVDFLARVCTAWDFDILPCAVTVEEIRKEEWTPAIEACRFLTSPYYHLLRRWHGLERLPFLGQIPAVIRNDPWLERV
jgi:hypothetical protein